MTLPDELTKTIATLKNIRKAERITCKSCNIEDCDKYLISEDDLKSSMPIYRIYYKLYSLSQKCPKMMNKINKYSKQFHKKQSNQCSSNQNCSLSNQQNSPQENQNNGSQENQQNCSQKNQNSSSSNQENNDKPTTENNSNKNSNSNQETHTEDEHDFYEKHRYHPVRSVGDDKFIEDLRNMKFSEIELPWDTLLKNILMGAIDNAEVIYPNWSKPNHRFIQYYQSIGAFIPSIQQTKPPNGFVVVDTSGSILDELYKKFIDVIVGLMNKTKTDRVEVIFFSDTIVDKKILTSDSIPPMPRPGEGGTLICDAMKYVYKNMTDDDFVVVLSDFDIFDNNECNGTIENIGKKASTAIQLVPPYGNIENKWKFWKHIIVNEFVT